MTTLKDLKEDIKALELQLDNALEERDVITLERDAAEREVKQAKDLLERNAQTIQRLEQRVYAAESRVTGLLADLDELHLTANSRLTDINDLEAKIRLLEANQGKQVNIKINL